MVTFARTPYAQAARRARVQDAIIYATLLGIIALVAILMVRLF